MTSGLYVKACLPFRSDEESSKNFFYAALILLRLAANLFDVADPFPMLKFGAISKGQFGKRHTQRAAFRHAACRRCDFLIQKNPEFDLAFRHADRQSNQYSDRISPALRI